MSDEDKIVNRTIDLLIGVREVREKFLSAFNGLQETRVTIFEGEAKRLRHIAGTKANQDPRVKMLEGKIMAANHMINSINVQLEILKISVPKIKEGQVLIHGRIIDENGYGIKNLVVSLLVEGRSLDIVGKSDASGYYSIIIPEVIIDKIKKHEIFVYVHFGTVLIHKAEDAIIIEEQKEIKFEVILSEDEIGMIHLQEKDKKVSNKEKIKKK